jgi:hypothetical protein
LTAELTAKTSKKTRENGTHALPTRRMPERVSTGDAQRIRMARFTLLDGLVRAAAVV